MATDWEDEDLDSLSSDDTDGDSEATPGNQITFTHDKKELNGTVQFLDRNNQPITETDRKSLADKAYYMVITTEDGQRFVRSRTNYAKTEQGSGFLGSSIAESNQDPEWSEPKRAGIDSAARDAHAKRQRDTATGLSKEKQAVATLIKTETETKKLNTAMNEDKATDLAALANARNNEIKTIFDMVRQNPSKSALEKAKERMAMVYQNYNMQLSEHNAKASRVDQANLNRRNTIETGRLLSGEVGRAVGDSNSRLVSPGTADMVAGYRQRGAGILGTPPSPTGFALGEVPDPVAAMRDTWETTTGQAPGTGFRLPPELGDVGPPPFAPQFQIPPEEQEEPLEVQAARAAAAYRAAAQALSSPTSSTGYRFDPRDIPQYPGQLPQR